VLTVELLKAARWFIIYRTLDLPSKEPVKRFEANDDVRGNKWKSQRPEHTFEHCTWFRFTWFCMSCRQTTRGRDRIFKHIDEAAREAITWSRSRDRCVVHPDMNQLTIFQNVYLFISYNTLPLFVCTCVFCMPIFVCVCINIGLRAKVSC
jgi:hypothetical protein